MLKNIERLQIQAKSFENAWRSIFLLKLKALNLQLIQKITSTTIVFQLIFLPLKNNCLSKKTSKKRKKKVKNLKYNVYYVTQGVLLFIFSCCTW